MFSRKGEHLGSVLIKDLPAKERKEVEKEIEESLVVPERDSGTDASGKTPSARSGSSK